MHALRMILAVALLSGLAAAAEPEKKFFTATTDADGVQRISLIGGEYFFDPNHIILKINVPVELSVRKIGGFVPHDIEMDSPEAGMKFEQSLGTDPKTISFTPTKTGLYPFFCTKRFLFFTSHQDKGMKGVIEVVE